jgi:hypothetical protein
MDDQDFEFDYGYSDGSDLDNFETEQVFQDHEGDEDNGDHEPDTDDPGVYGPSEDHYLDSMYEDRYDCGDYE